MMAPPSSSQNIVTPLQLHLRRSCRNIDILPRRLYFSFFFVILTPPTILDISTPFEISRVSINTGYPNNPKINPQAQPGVLVPFLIVISLVKVEANKTKEK